MDDGPIEGRGGPGWRATIAAGLAYLAALVPATYPTFSYLTTRLPDACDTLQHLWIMRWYRTCLLEGRSPLVCPEIQYPVGGPLGNFSSLAVQGLLYIPLSFVLDNDILIYNTIWCIVMVASGLGAFLLAWHVIGDRACAWLAGLLAMLSGPMLIHAHAHLELITIGGFPLFLLAWLRLVDRPTPGRLAAAVGAYTLVAMSAAYFAVFAVFPAVAYVVDRSIAAARRGDVAWPRSRAAWLLGFSAAALPCLAAVFAPQVWAMIAGEPPLRSRVEFEKFGAPLWSYLAPTAEHRLSRLLPWDPYAALGPGSGERAAYLGVVTIGLMAYAASARPAFRRAGYWWAAFGLLVVLSLGATWKVGSAEISLPAAWAWKVFYPFRMTRVPARLALFAGVIGGLIAGAGLRHLLGRIAWRAGKAAAFAGCVALSIADLAMPFWPQPVEPLPAAYSFIRASNAEARILEAPIEMTGGSVLNAACTYWQASHRLRTNAGYSGHPNAAFDDRLGFGSPFLARYLKGGRPAAGVGGEDFDVVRGAGYLDYVWLYLTAHGFDYLVLHQWPQALADFPGIRLDRLKELLEPAKVFEDARTAVYDRTRLPTPARPVLLGPDPSFGRGPWRRRWNCALPKSGRIVAYNPDPDRPLTLAIEAEAFKAPRVVRLTSGGLEIARWDVVPGAFQTLESPPVFLPAGLQELVVESDGEERPAGRREAMSESSRRPYSLRVAAVSLLAADGPVAVAPADSGRR